MNKNETLYLSEPQSSQSVQVSHGGSNLSDRQIFLSIIICTYNRDLLLEKCLLSIGLQENNFQDVEVIIVDNNSTDSTFQIVRRLRARFGFMVYCYESNQGLQWARNRGWEKARGKYLAYIDDDAIIPSNYVSNILCTLYAFIPDIMGGPVYPYYLTSKPYWFKDEYEIRHFADMSGFSTTCRVSGSNFIVKRSVLERLGKFDVRFGIVGKKLGMGGERAVIEKYRNTFPLKEQKIYYDLNSYVFHYVPDYKLTLTYQAKRKFLSGSSMARINGFGFHYLVRKTFSIFAIMTANHPSGSLSMKVSHFTFVDLLHSVFMRIGLIYGIFQNMLKSQVAESRAINKNIN